eukprot:13952515-Alexandrium_andersonii.AAC.1
MSPRIAREGAGRPAPRGRAAEKRSKHFSGSDVFIRVQRRALRRVGRRSPRASVEQRITISAAPFVYPLFSRGPSRSACG